RLHGCSRYDYMEVIGRVESGTETESDAGSQSRDPVHPTRGYRGPVEKVRLTGGKYSTRFPLPARRPAQASRE
ncbi:MAG: hypothetical protein KAJ03_08500, partial [Gammaproteobacteria bacterium]|nr:hypothetical protein [Gammaproteobacteria bacterium]